MPQATSRRPPDSTSQTKPRTAPLGAEPEDRDFFEGRPPYLIAPVIKTVDFGEPQPGDKN